VIHDRCKVPALSEPATTNRAIGAIRSPLMQLHDFAAM
jgi:hypothetical protein